MQWLGYSLTAMFLQGLLLFLVKLFSFSIHPLSLLLLQYLSSVVVIFVFIILKKISLRINKNDFAMLLLSGFLVSTGLALYYNAISLANVSRVVPAHNVGITLLPALLAFVLLKERITRRLVLGLLCSVACIIFLTL